MALWYQDLRGVGMAEKKKAKANSKNAGRRDYYQERIEPRLDEIKKWYSIGVSEEQVYKNLGVGRTTYYKYKKSKPELQEAIKAGVMPIVVQVRSALVKSALGYTYTEKKTYIKNEPTADGKTKPVTYEEITERYAQPNVASCNLLLKNLDKDNWANDPQAMRMRELELKHKKQVAENNIFLPICGEEEEGNK